ncbi:MAG: hypothetical protein J3R72DRAFT_509854 [Linnemannia gamsii]|nr:MAG: hypothetical protein J3R72DRAFT_509854 [Linnemannia gamsii]
MVKSASKTSTSSSKTSTSSSKPSTSSSKPSTSSSKLSTSSSTTSSASITASPSMTSSSSSSLTGAPIHTLLSIPELTIILASFLDQRTLTLLLFISKSFQEVFTPFAFKDLDLRNESRYFMAVVRKPETSRLLQCCSCYTKSIRGGQLMLDRFVPNDSSFKRTSESPNGPSAGQPLGPLGDMQLVDLRLENLNIRKHSQLMLVLQLISGMDVLRYLALCPVPIMNNKKAGEGLFRVIISCFPKTLESLSLAQQQLDKFQGGREQKSSEDYAIRKREGPLTRLRKLDVFHPGNFAPDIFSELLSNCPKIKSFTVLGSSSSSSVAVEMVRALCPNIQELYIRSCSGKHQPQGKHGLTWAEGMKPGTLKSLRVDEYNGARLRGVRAIQQHSSSLTRVHLGYFQYLDKDMVQATLKSCSSLSVLIFDGMGKAVAPPIDTIVNINWAVTALTVLQLVFTVRFQDRGYFEAGRRHYSPNRADRDEWLALEDLARKLGRVVTLEELTLAAVEEKKKEQTCVPGILTLGNRIQGQLGFLNMLSELKSLKAFRGHFHLNQPEMEATFKREEAVWIVNNWPSLRSIDLLGPKMKPIAIQQFSALRWLKEEMPEIQFL